MRQPDVTVRDPNTGQIIFEGFLHNYYLNLSGGGYTFEVKGSIAPSGQKPAGSISHSDFEEPLDIVKDAYPMAASQPSCYHDWQDYQGLVENYTFCKTCGVKK